MKHSTKINQAYLAHQAIRTLRLSWITVIIGIPAIFFFMYTDITVIKLDPAKSIPWRALGLLPLLIFIPLSLTRFRKNPEEIVRYHMIALGGIVVMISGLTFVIFDLGFQSEDIAPKFGAVSGYLLVILGVFLLSGGAKKYFKYFLGIPLALLFIAFLISQNMEANDWGIMTNVVIAAAVTIILSQQQAKSEFREFELNEKLAISEEELRAHRNRLQELVDERTEQLKQALDRADSMNKLKTIMLSNLTHELRTPAGSIRSLVDLFRVEDANPDIKVYTDMLQESSDRLLGTIGNTIRFSELESGIIEPKIEKIDYQAIFQRELENHQGKIVEKGLSIVLEGADNLPSFQSDGQILRQITHHLLDNAIKFTDEGTIHVSYKLKGNNFHFCVKDTGRGISTQALEFITAPFRQESEGLTRDHAGSGLGLAMVKGYLDILEGKLMVASQKEKGSSFSFEIPVTLIPNTSL